MTNDELLARYDRLHGALSDDPTAMAYEEIADSLAAALRASEKNVATVRQMLDDQTDNSIALQAQLRAAENVIREALVTVANGDLRATRTVLSSYKPEEGKD